MILDSLWLFSKLYCYKQRLTTIMGRQMCTKCRSIPTNVLVLECSHNLCIKCASKICQIGTNSIVCPSCKICTYLDEDIVNQIYQFSIGAQEEQVRRSRYIDQSQNTEPAQNWKVSHKENSIPEISTYSMHRTDKSKTSYKIDQQKPHKKKPVKDYQIYESLKTQKQIINCKQHSEYEIMYICLDCDSCFVCPECVIHGSHNSHQVQTIKKTVVKIHAEISSKIYSLDCSIEGLVQASENRKKTLRQKVQQINKLKMQAISRYKLIRQEIAREESEIISKCSALVEQFQCDFSQVQSWIKNDLSVIQKERDLISSILNPQQNRCQKNGKKENKIDNRLAEMRVVEEYLIHIKKNEKMKNKKFLWINNKQKMDIQPESQQNLQVLTDRIQRIKLVSGNFTGNRIENQNEITTKGNSLAASRSKVNRISEPRQSNTNQNKEPNRQKYWQSPFNTLKMSGQKQNGIFETQSILVKGSNIRDSVKIKKKTLKSQQENNFLIF